MNNERWRPVLGWEGLYEVSNLGNVRSVARWVRCRNGKRLIEGRVLTPRVSVGLYYRVFLSHGTKSTQENIHRLVAKAFIPGDGAVVRHLDGNGFNNAVENLSWGTHADNEADKRRHGRVPFGERHGMAVLNAGLVKSIRQMHGCGFSQLAIAKALELNRGIVGNVVRGESWTHVS